METDPPNNEATHALPKEANRLPPLKTDPRYGHYPWWPEEGDAWIHPSDVALARTLIPGPRIWRREGSEGSYLVIHYGELRLRLQRALWIEVEHEGFDIGDPIEILPHGMKNDAQVGTIREMHWEPHEGRIEYQILTADQTPLETWFHSEDMKHVEATRREPEFRIEPREDFGNDLEVEPE